MMHWRVDANWCCCCSKTKKFILTSILAPLKNLQCLHCWEKIIPNSYLLVQILNEVLKKKKVKNSTARQKHCASMIVVGPCTCYMLTLILSWFCNVDLPSLSLVFVVLIPSWFCNIDFQHCHFYLPYWCHLCHLLNISIIIPNFFFSVISLSVYGKLR